MNDPAKAIEFAETWEKKAPDNIKLSFKYFIAKVAADKNTSRKKAKDYINYFIKNFDANKTQYSLDDARKVQDSLMKK